MKNGDFICIREMGKRSFYDFLQNSANSSQENEILLKKYGNSQQGSFIVADTISFENGSLIGLLPVGCLGNLPDNHLRGKIAHPENSINLKHFFENNIRQVEIYEGTEVLKFYLKKGDWSERFTNVLRPLEDGLLGEDY